MSQLLWPGDDLAGDVMTDAAVLDAMVRVEKARSDSLIAVGIAPPAAAVKARSARGLAAQAGGAAGTMAATVALAGLVGIAEPVEAAQPAASALAERMNLAEPGRGASSTMPHKANPVRSVLIRRAALAGPGLAAQLHLAAATTVDERPDGAWHVEWATLQTLMRRTVNAGNQTTQLMAGLRIDDALARAANFVTARR